MCKQCSTIRPVVSVPAFKLLDIVQVRDNVISAKAGLRGVVTGVNQGRADVLFPSGSCGYFPFDMLIRIANVFGA